ncbi:MAG: CoA transferase [Dehalococcoidia bacterium]
MTRPMAGNPDTSGPLGPYRVLDLTEGGFNWCGRLLADLGADVIKVEPPDGSPTRWRGPFYRDVVDPNRSLFWYAYCLNKRSVTLDLESQDGQRQLKRLAAASDFVIESFPPGYLTSLGLGYEGLSAINPGLVFTSITPFGQTGPYADYKATDLVGWSMGGMQYLGGDDDRPPVRMAVPQAELHAAAQAAAGSMIALWERGASGRGQHVDVSMQAAVIWATYNAAAWPALNDGENLERGGSDRKSGNLLMREVFPCWDGYVRVYAAGGAATGRSMHALVRWMDEEGCAPDFMKQTDWTQIDMTTLPALSPESREVEEFHAMQAAVGEFLVAKTKRQLFERAVADGILLAPCQTTQDLWECPQLNARRFWIPVEHTDLATTISYPGPYVKLSRTPIAFNRRPPLIGEHNPEVLLQDPPAAANQQGGASPQPSTGDSLSPPAFDGLRVLDMSWVGVGPMTMKFLADHGATVIRVESVVRPDPSRTVGPFKNATPGINRGQFSANFNTSKYSLGLNLGTAQARDLVKRIIGQWQPDVLAESFTPGSMRKWGLDYEAVCQLRPDIVYFSTCQLGQTGPLARYAGYGGMASALAGFLQMTGWPDRMPAGPFGPYTDFVNPPNAVTAVIAALEYRRRTGKGQRLDLSQYECAIHYLAPAMLDYAVNGRVQQRNGNHDDVYAPHGVYPCKAAPSRPGGSWCAIAVTSEAEWAALKSAMGDPQWSAEARFAGASQRSKHSQELDALLAAWTAQFDAHELMRRLQDVGVPAGVVQAASDLWEDPQLKHRGFFQWLKHAESGLMPYSGLQFTLSRTPGKLKWAGPTVGQHNQHVLKEIIGLRSEEIADLIAAGALEASY